MPVTTLAQQLRYCTVRITTDRSIGTGFLYSTARDEGFLVTNKHVIEDAATGSLRMVRGLNGEPVADFVDIPFNSQERFDSLWHGHPDPEVDVAVLPFSMTMHQLIAAKQETFHRGIHAAMCPPPALLTELDAIETVTFVGYPRGLIDTVNHTPVVRQGISATPIYEDWCGKPQMLIDASVYPGSSGSPVFLIRPGVRSNPQGHLVFGQPETYLLGILAAGYHNVDTGEIVMTTHAPHAVFRQMIDIGIVYKWPTIEEAIDDMCAKFRVIRPPLPVPSQAEADATVEATA